MTFPAEEHAAMLALKGVGPTVIRRLTQLGYRSLAQLADAEADTLCRQIAALVGSSCWQNSPQARASIAAIITLAQQNAPR